MVRSVRRILKRISSRIIKNRIKSGKPVYFESLLEELAIKYIPDKRDNFGGKYYAKYYGQEEYEINPDSSSIFLAVNEGMLMSKYRYNRFHLVKSDLWNRKVRTPVTDKSAGI
jgi:hypothetical protein